ncbi:MAG: 3'-5' exonuclease [Desulfovibrionaceae bacterium]|jgi:DNA polymerase-3 subunit epsilon|nr:3'-5' exonuclease [Desulfovibrionaceae bacterium]
MIAATNTLFSTDGAERTNGPDRAVGADGAEPRKRLLARLWADTARAARRVAGRAPVHPAVAANRALFRRADQDRPLAECSFAVVDTELTGLNPRRDEIVSIGAVRVRGLAIDPADGFYAEVRPAAPLPKTSTLIHRITPQCVAHAPCIAQVLPDFLEYLGDSFIVGHHVGLDMSFLNAAARRHLGGRIATPCVDTMRLARAFREESWRSVYDAYDGRISYNLADLARELGLPRCDEHNAYWDAMQAAYLFVFLVRKLRKGEVRTIRELHAATRPRRWC